MALKAIGDRTVFSACELGQDAKRAGLGGAGFGVPVLGVLHQALLACIVERIIVCIGLPV